LFSTAFSAWAVFLVFGAYSFALAGFSDFSSSLALEEFLLGAVADQKPFGSGFWYPIDSVSRELYDRVILTPVPSRPVVFCS
jgi:hypothetical protein